MPAPTACCNPCDPTTIVEVPGVQGDTGSSAYSYTFGSVNNLTKTTSYSITVLDSSPFAVGLNIVIEDAGAAGTVPGYFIITTIVGNVLTVTYLDIPANTNGSTSGSGKLVSIAAPSFAVTGLPTAIVDAGLTAAPVLAVNTAAFQIGTAEYVLTINFVAAAITGNVLLYTFTPGHRFRIRKISASCVGAVTTGAKAATLATAIAGTPTTGGIVILSGAYALGAQQASSVVITANDTGTAAQAITITASAVTVFIEGAFCIHLVIQNLDTADALVTLSEHVNDLITVLT